MDSISSCFDAEYQFRDLGGYRDAPERADFCVQERQRIKDALQKDAKEHLINTIVLRSYTVFAVFIVLLVGILFSTKISNAVPLWVGLTLALLISGIVICLVYNPQKNKSRVGIVSILPAFALGIETLVYSTSSDYGDLTGTCISALFIFVITFLVAFSSIKNEANHLFISDGTRQIRLKQYMNRSFSTVIIPASVTRIKDHAFANCPNLSVIIYQGTQNAWNAILKGTGWISGMKQLSVQCTDGRITYMK